MSGMDESGNDRIDQAIDEAARGLTAGEPGPGFTMRVMTRVHHRPAVWNRRVVMAPLGIAAVIAIASGVLVIRMSNIPPADAPSASSAIADAISQQRPAFAADALRGDEESKRRLAPSPSTDSSLQPALSRSLSAPPRSRGALSAPAGALSASAGAPSFVASLAPPPIDVPSIVLPSLDAGDSLDVPALVPLAPIVLAPLDQPEGDQP